MLQKVEAYRSVLEGTIELGDATKCPLAIRAMGEPLRQEILNQFGPDRARRVTAFCESYYQAVKVDLLGPKDLERTLLTVLTSGINLGEYLVTVREIKSWRARKKTDWDLPLPQTKKGLQGLREVAQSYTDLSQLLGLEERPLSPIPRKDDFRSRNTSSSATINKVRTPDQALKAKIDSLKRSPDDYYGDQYNRIVCEKADQLVLEEAERIAEPTKTVTEEIIQAATIQLRESVENILEYSTRLVEQELKRKIVPASSTLIQVPETSPTVPFPSGQKNYEKIIAARKMKEKVGLAVERERKLPAMVIGEYLDALEKHNPEYFAEVQQLVKQCPPMDPQTRCVVPIPIIGFGGQAEISILQTLEVLKQQEIREEEVDITCFVNKPPFVEFDQTAEIIQAFSETNPDAQVSVIKGVILRKRGRSRPLMGRIRALLTDAALVRIYEAFKNRPERRLPIIVLADSDTENIAPRALQTYIATFDKESNIDLIIGELRWESREYPTASFPTLFVGDELMYQLPQCNKMALNSASKKQKLTEEEVRALIANVFSGSFTKGVQVNIAFRPEAYAACGGGFDSEQDINELDFLVRIIAFSGLSEGRCNIKAMNGAVKVSSSSRRALLEYLEGEGRAPIQQWRGSFGLRVQDPARIQKPELLGIIPLENIGERGKEDLALAIEGQINSTFEDYTIPPAVPGWYQDAISEVYIPALASIGLRPEEYSIQPRTKKDGTVQLTITVTDPTGLLKRLQDVQREKIKEMKPASRFEEVEVEPEQIVDGYVVTSPQETKRWVVFDRASVIYDDGAESGPSKIKTKILKLPI